MEIEHVPISYNAGAQPYISLSEMLMTIDGTETPKEVRVEKVRGKFDACAAETYRTPGGR
jgi:hypothetical protein